MNNHLEQLQPYPFEKLATLKAAVKAPSALRHIALSIGEPKHPAPDFVLDCIQRNVNELVRYPLTKGLPELRQAIADWASQRFHLKPDSLNADRNVLPVAGTREALFAFAQAVINKADGPQAASTKTAAAKIVMPNPFYQIYEGACILAGAEPYFVNCSTATDLLPDFSAVPDQVWQDCQLLYICNPGNPTGAVMSVEQQIQLIELADRFNFIIASDECYSELYFDESQPPTGLLETCSKLGRDDFKRCVVFHSLSKRSNLPGLRSGFVAGDAHVLEDFLRYRTYQGCALPVPTQLASIEAWRDEQHVLENRNLYRAKFDAVLQILQGHLDVEKPDAGFYLWPRTPIPDTDFAQGLYAQQNVTVLPGRYLARETNTGNPGENYVRMALVATLDECIEAAERIVKYVKSLQ